MRKVIYALYDKGEFVGNYCAKEINQITGLTSRMVSRYAESGLLYHKRYTLERIREYTPENMEYWSQEWNQVRQEILVALIAAKHQNRAK